MSLAQLQRFDEAARRVQAENDLMRLQSFAAANAAGWGKADGYKALQKILLDQRK